MKVVGYRTYRDPSAEPGEQWAHVAVLGCGHTRRVSHGHAPSELTCDEGCDLRPEPPHRPECHRIGVSGRFIFPNTACTCGAFGAEAR